MSMLPFVNLQKHGWEGGAGGGEGGVAPEKYLLKV